MLQIIQDQDYIQRNTIINYGVLFYTMQASSSYPQILGQLIWFCLPSHEGPLLDNNHRTIHGIMLGSLACKQIYLTPGLDAIDQNNQMSWPILFTLGQQIITHTHGLLKHFYRPLNLLSWVCPRELR